MGAEGFARIVIALTEPDLDTFIDYEAFPEILQWLMSVERSETVSAALTRIASAIRRRSH